MRGLAILFFAFLSALVAARNSSDSEVSLGQDGSVASNLSSSSSGQSQCQICANAGDCSESYNDEPGQYCYDWVDKQGTTRPCCCPMDTICESRSGECRCTHDSSRSKTRNDDTSHTGSWWKYLVTGLALIVSIALCIAAIVYRLRQYRRNNRDRAAYMAPLSPMTVATIQIVPYNISPVNFRTPPRA